MGKLGSKHTPETIAKMKVAQAGNKHWNWKGGNSCFCGKRLHLISTKHCFEHRDLSGATHPRWKGGVSKDKAHKKLLYKAWVQANHGHRMELNRKRRNLERAIEGFHTIEEWMALKIYFGIMCLCCKLTEPEIILTEDHIIPLTKGGTDNIENIQPLCRSCNSRKYNKEINLTFNGAELLA